MRYQLTDLILHLQSGAYAADVQDAFDEVVKASTTHSLPGSITLKIEVKPEAEFVSILGSFSSRKPRKKSGNIFYATTDGSLYREDPRQMKLDFDTPTQPAADHE